MRKAAVIAVLALLATVGMRVQVTKAQEEKAKTTSAKQLRWDGHIVRIDMDHSTMDIRNSKGMQRTIHWNDSTTWTKLNKPVTDKSEFKEEARVICLGKAENGEFVATRIDLRVHP
jgi:hypothetical protein